MKHLEPHVSRRIAFACRDLIDDALRAGMDAKDLKQMLAEVWADELHDRAERGAKELLS